MQLLPKQENAVYYLKDQETSELIFGGGAGGAKSALGCLWLIEQCQTYPGTRWAMCRSKLKTLKETTLNTFLEITGPHTEETRRLQKIRLDIRDQFNYNAQMGVILFNNGSEIILRDLFLYPSDPHFDSLGSLEITGAFVDECNQIVLKAWQVLKSRCRYKLDEYGLNPKILGTCNPSKNWVYKLFYNPWKTGNLPTHRKFVQALAKENPHLPDSYIENLNQMDEASRQRLLHGNWEYDNDPATLISYNAIMDYWNGQHVQPEGNKYLTIDVARKGKDKTVFRVWHGWVVIERHEIATGPLTQVVDKAKELQKTHAIPNSRTIADEDGLGCGVVDFLMCLGFVNNARPEEELIGDTYQTPNYSNLKSQCSVRMAKRIMAKEVVEYCNDNTIIDLVSEEMEQVKLKDVDKDGKTAIIGKDKVKEMIGRSPDDWDSIIMREYFELAPEFYIA